MDHDNIIRDFTLNADGLFTMTDSSGRSCLVQLSIASLLRMLETEQFNSVNIAEKVAFKKSTLVLNPPIRGGRHVFIQIGLPHGRRESHYEFVYPAKSGEDK
jgi:hypothetical protein